MSADVTEVPVSWLDRFHRHRYTCAGVAVAAFVGLGFEIYHYIDGKRDAETLQYQIVQAQKAELERYKIHLAIEMDNNEYMRDKLARLLAVGKPNAELAHWASVMIKADIVARDANDHRKSIEIEKQLYNIDNPALIDHDVVSYAIGASYILLAMTEHKPTADLQNAIKYLREPAERGVRHSAWYLGEALTRGCDDYELSPDCGLSPNYVEGVIWLERAASKQDVWAEFSLGLIYEEGKPGVPKNREQAARWYQAAAAQGNEQASAALKRLGQD